MASHTFLSNGLLSADLGEEKHVMKCYPTSQQWCFNVKRMRIIIEACMLQMARLRVARLTSAPSVPSCSGGWRRSTSTLHTSHSRPSAQANKLDKDWRTFAAALDPTHSSCLPPSTKRQKR